jgi:hypothetical protein
MLWGRASRTHQWPGPSPGAMPERFCPELANTVWTGRIRGKLMILGAFPSQAPWQDPGIYRTGTSPEHHKERPGVCRGAKFKGSRPVSRVLSGTVIHLGHVSPRASSGLPGCDAGHIDAPLFGLAPGGVCRAAACCHPRGALLPHHFTLACPRENPGHRRYVFCGTFRRLAPPRRYLAPCPAEPGLSSTAQSATATVRPTPGR